MFVNTHAGRLQVRPLAYRANLALALELVDPTTRERYTVITVNLPGAHYQLSTDEVFVKTWSENEPLVPALLASGLFEDTGLREPTGFVQAQVWRMKGELLERVFGALMEAST